MSITHVPRHRAPALIPGLALIALLAPAAAPGATYPLPPPEVGVIGELVPIPARHDETVLDIGRRYNVGHEELRLANPHVDPWMPGEGTRVLIPSQYVLPEAPRNGVVINVAEMRLYYFPKPERDQPAVVVTHPMSVGRLDWKTPLGTTRVTRKAEDPTWTPPASIRREHAERGDILPNVVPAGPDNPLGRHALYLGVPGYLIHGTNRPEGIGMRVTHGCIRLYPEDVEALYARVPVGTPVHLVDQPYKLGWKDGTLYLEVHPPLGEADLGSEEDARKLLEAVTRALVGHEGLEVDWGQVEAEVARPSGIPIPLRTRLRQEGEPAFEPGLSPRRGKVDSLF